MHLRHKLRARFGEICCQESIDGLELGGMIEFEFKRCYKTPGASHETTLIHFRFRQLIKAHNVERRAIFEPQSSQTTIDNSNKMVVTRRGVGFVERTANEAAYNPMVQDVLGDARDMPEISTSP